MHYWWYYDSRWNGRQIRNACQTALALAEYQAQQDSKSTELDSKVPVKLGVDYFETVRNAYLEFTKYLVDLYGASTAAVAEERYLRAKEKANGGRDPLFTTNQLLRMKKDGAEPGRFKSPTLQRKPSQGVYNSGEADQRSWERRSLKSQNASSTRDRNQTDFSSSNPTAGPIQRFLQSERLGPPRDLSQQLDIERESSSRSYNNSQRSKGKRGSQSNWDHDDFEEDGSEYSDTQRRRQNRRQNRRQQEPDGMSEEEQEDDDDDFSLEEEAAPANNRGRREPDEPRYTRNRK
ncbi:hypothetical protein TrVFT333_008927 [Trichoderma virens FT-333]|nr:hypothetical protein TrVFT333_008927 [Trichoderma virens FT-333]